MKIKNFVFSVLQVLKFSFFISLFFISSFGMVSAQGDVENDLETAETENGRTIDRSTLEEVVEIDDTTPGNEAEMTATTYSTPTFVDSHTEAPSSGPAELIIIIAAITFGLLGTIIFLSLVIHDHF